MKRAINRRGASVLELAIVLTVFVIISFGMFDLGAGVFRYHILANAARQAARLAIVRGANATVLGRWGPATRDAASDVEHVLVGCDMAHTTVQVEWLDADNAIGHRVRATAASPYKPFMPFLSPVILRASSTMQIAH